MIAKLTGQLSDLKPTELILEVQGVGYLLQIPFSTYKKIQDQKKITLQVHTWHKEDQFKLFGFHTTQEKEIFSILINISGVGPSLALSLLSGISIEDLVNAIQTDNSSLLIKIPGIGKNKAEKLIFELKRKIKKLESFATSTPAQPSLKNNAVEALASLGFKEIEAYKIVDQIVKDHQEASLEFIIKEALKLLS